MPHINNIKLVGAVGLEPTVAFGGGFTARWGYQFSYTPVIFVFTVMLFNIAII